MKTSKKKNSFHNKQSIYTFALSLRSSYYAYFPPYMNKTLPTLGNEKEQRQIKFYEKLILREFIFLQETKNLKMFYFCRPTGRVHQGCTNAYGLVITYSP